MKYEFIEQQRQLYPIERLCQVLNVSRSGYYAWKKRPICRRKREDGLLLNQIEQIHREAHRIYGSRRVHAALAHQGIGCSLYKVARLMRELGLVGCRRQRRPRTTTPFPGVLPFMNNQLNRNFQAAKANTKWVADITYIDTQEGYLYLAAILDLYSRKIVGWAMENHLRESLVEQALHMALELRCPAPGLLHHSDRGSQYASHAYLLALEKAQIQISMSRVGNCLDNAAMESFFSSLKTEWVFQHFYATRAEAKQSIFYYIEAFYNRQRLHSSLGYTSPHLFETQSMS